MSRPKRSTGAKAPSMKIQMKINRDLARLVAEVIRRMGAAYGDIETWRSDFTLAVKIMEASTKAITDKKGDL